MHYVTVSYYRELRSEIKKDSITTDQLKDIALKLINQNKELYKVALRSLSSFQQQNKLIELFNGCLGSTMPQISPSSINDIGAIFCMNMNSHISAVLWFIQALRVSNMYSFDGSDGEILKLLYEVGDPLIPVLTKTQNSLLRIYSIYQEREEETRKKKRTAPTNHVQINEKNSKKQKKVRDSNKVSCTSRQDYSANAYQSGMSNSKCYTKKYNFKVVNSAKTRAWKVVNKCKTSVKSKGKVKEMIHCVTQTKEAQKLNKDEKVSKSLIVEKINQSTASDNNEHVSTNEDQLNGKKPVLKIFDVWSDPTASKEDCEIIKQYKKENVTEYPQQQVQLDEFRVVDAVGNCDEENGESGGTFSVSSRSNSDVTRNSGLNDNPNDEDNHEQKSAFNCDNEEEKQEQEYQNEEENDGDKVLRKVTPNPYGSGRLITGSSHPDDSKKF